MTWEIGCIWLWLARIYSIRCSLSWTVMTDLINNWRVARSSNGLPPKTHHIKVISPLRRGTGRLGYYPYIRPTILTFILTASLRSFSVLLATRCELNHSFAKSCRQGHGYCFLLACLGWNFYLPWQYLNPTLSYLLEINFPSQGGVHTVDVFTYF